MGSKKLLSGKVTMLFNQNIIRRKEELLDSTPEKILLDGVSYLIGDVDTIIPLQRPWSPGGGASLFRVKKGREQYFFKVKHKDLWVESRLESEREFSTTNALENESFFLKILEGNPYIPKLIDFCEIKDYVFLLTEILQPFELAIENLTAYERFEAYNNLYNFVHDLFERDIVHTDIHEKNICFRGKVPVLCDFEEARLFKQELHFKESLDVTGINIYGNVGEFPLTDTDDIPGFTCLRRLKNVFRKEIMYNFPDFLAGCNFDDNCPYNYDEFQQKDDRIYQSISLSNCHIIGQRPAVDHRQKVLTRLLPLLSDRFGKKLFLVDLGSNIGTISLKCADSPYVNRVLGLEAFKNYIAASELFRFIGEYENVSFQLHVAGEDEITERADIFLLLSVYHHIQNKSAFLKSLAAKKPSVLFAEFATQNRYYKERGNIEAEIRHIKKYLGYSHAQTLCYTIDYKRPLVLFSNALYLNNREVNSLAYGNIFERGIGFAKKAVKKKKRIKKGFMRNVIRGLTETHSVALSIPDAFKLSLNWIKNHSEDGIMVSSKNRNLYPEVTGYFIPTLLNWGISAVHFGDWLFSIQNPDGSWNDSSDLYPYTFDTGQILKGLLTLIDIRPHYEPVIIKGCEWILKQQRPDGSIGTPNTEAWGGIVPESIHLYTLSPLLSAGLRFGREDFCTAAKHALDFYVKDPKLTEFSTLSHFHAYILEALVDLGEFERAREGMGKISKFMQRDRAVPGWSNVHWICSTGLFQYALIWYKLGELGKGDALFLQSLNLQNKSGGFFGSYGTGANYFPNEEISWAIKYFFDALLWMLKAHFNEQSESFLTNISKNDGRYRLVREAISKSGASTVLDAGCGKGRYLKNLKQDFPNLALHGVDLSENVLSFVPKGIDIRVGSLLNIPFPDDSLDIVFTCEALEHAVYIEGAIQELARVIRSGGTLVIIDKNLENTGEMQIEAWEQWFSEDEITEILRNEGFTVTVHRNIPYHDNDGSDGLFIGWVAHNQ
jgi:malonyl-CoA O-methyltransferase